MTGKVWIQFNASDLVGLVLNVTKSIVLKLATIGIS